MNELIAATNKARSTYDATCVFCADEVSTLGRQFSGRPPCVVGIRAEEKKTVNAMQIQIYESSRLFLFFLLFFFARRSGLGALLS